MRGDHRAPEFLAPNPKGRVPTLIADGEALNENIAILSWLAEVYPDAGLSTHLAPPMTRAQFIADLSFFCLGPPSPRHPDKNSDKLRRPRECRGRVAVGCESHVRQSVRNRTAAWRPPLVVGRPMDDPRCLSRLGLVSSSRGWARSYAIPGHRRPRCALRPTAGRAARSEARSRCCRCSGGAKPPSAISRDAVAINWRCYC